MKDVKAIERAVKELFNHHSRWHILVNNAATVIRAPLLELAVEDWDLIHQVNLRAVFVLSRLIAKQMIPNLLE